MDLVVTAVFAYILGSVPFGIVSAAIFGLGNLREIGSGNIGATNVLRTGNKLAAFITLIGDAGKGALAVVAARIWIGEDAAGVAALFALIGHLFPVFLRFKGGKGVATFLGTLLALSFWVGAAACLTWLVVAVMFRFSSLAALVSAAAAPVFALIFYHWHGAVVVAAMAILVAWRHKGNIARLLDGTEPRIGKK